MFWCIATWDQINNARLTWLSLNNVLIMSLMTLIMSLLSESFLSEPKLWSVLQRTHLIYCVQFISMDGHHLVWVHLSWPVLQILKSTKGHQKISFGSFAIILIKMNLQSFLSFNNKVVLSHCVFFLTTEHDWIITFKGT